MRINQDTGKDKGKVRKKKGGTGKTKRGEKKNWKKDWGTEELKKERKIVENTTK